MASTCAILYFLQSIGFDDYRTGGSLSWGLALMGKRKQHDAHDTLPVIPWYWRDWRASKARAVMPPEVRGVYRELLDALWGEPDCSLPNDDAILAGLAGITMLDWQNVRAQVLAWFDETNGRITNRRALHEWKKAKKFRTASRASGRRGGKAKAEKKLHEQQKASDPRATLAQKASDPPSQSLAKATSPSPPPTPTPRTEERRAAPANPLLGPGDRPRLESECLALVRRMAALTGEDAVDVIARASGYEGARTTKVNPASMTDDRLINTVRDLKADVAAEEKKRGAA